MKQTLILLDGMMGAGKTTTTNILSEQLSRTAIIGMDKVKRFVSDFERNERDNGIAREVVIAMTKKYLELGLSVIVDQPFKSAGEIKTYEDMASDVSVPCYKFQLYTKPEIAFERIVLRQESQKSKVSEERIRRNLSLYEDRVNLGFKTIDTTDKEPQEVVNTILDSIAA
jgi:thymidylate kinase